MNDDLIRALGTLEGKVDLILERTEKIETHTDKLGERVSKIEHESTATKSVLAAGAAVVATVGGAVGALADRLFK